MNARGSDGGSGALKLTDGFFLDGLNQEGPSIHPGLRSNLQQHTYSGLPGPCAAGFNGDGAVAVSGGGVCFVALGDHGRSFKGRGRFGGSLILLMKKK